MHVFEANCAMQRKPFKKFDQIRVVWTCLDLEISVAKEAYTLFNLLDDDRDGEVSYDAGLRS
jgi:hypothetical protein